MKKCFLCLLCVLMVLSTLAGCRKESDTYSSWYSYIEVEDENDSNATSSNNKIQYDSTIPTPESMTLYKGGMQASVKDKTLRRKAAKEIEKLFYDYTQDNLPTVDMEITRQFIWELKQNETVIELHFHYDSYEEINLLGKIKIEKIGRILVPLTGEYAYYLFSGSLDGDYKNTPCKLKGSGLEKIFEGVTLDKKVRDWESTVIAPTTVTFYKDGATAVSTDKELNLKIAQHIENWFKYEESVGMAATTYTDDQIDDMKRNERAIQLHFDDDITFFGNVKFSNSRTLFITVPENKISTIYHNKIDAPYMWPIPQMGGMGLVQYFEYVQFAPLTEEEMRWRSTVSAASSIKAYENRKIVGKTENAYKDTNFPLKYDIMKHIESWFYHKEDVTRIDTCITDTTLKNIKSNEKCLEIHLKYPTTTFYGKQILPLQTYYILIPITGEYAYHIFEGDVDENYSSVAIVTDGSGLEDYFEKIKTASQNSQ